MSLPKDSLSKKLVTYKGTGFVKMCEEENKAAYQQQMFYSHVKSI